ncbi:MAG: peptidylprolyl isomerase [Verrucomicrobiota bacterium]
MIFSRPFPLLAALPLLLPSAAWAAAPNAPTNFTVRMLSPTEIRLDWTDNSTDEAGFEIQYRIGTSGDFASLGRTVSNAVSQPINGTSPNTTYQFQIRAASLTAPVENSDFAGPLTVITPRSDYSAALGQPLNLPLDLNNPPAGTKYAASKLPSGLALNGDTGAITGTPDVTGFSDIPLTITYPDKVTGTWTLTVLVLNAPVSTSPLPAQSSTVGTAAAPVSLTGFFSDPDVSSAARVVTDEGTMDFAFYSEKAPLTVANFLGYATRGDFTNTFFHRSAPGFVVQAGAFRADPTASVVPTQPAVKNEPGITNARSTVAMAKLEGDPNSATNQFFVNLGNNSANLDNQNGGFTVFARVTGTGMAVADAIADLPVKNYASVNRALTNTPVRGGVPPAVYDPALLVRISSVAVLPPLSFSAVSAAPAVAECRVDGGNLTITPVSPGETTVTVTATDLDGLTATSGISVSVMSASYETWVAGQTFAAPADSAASADPDSDGHINLVEFALASPPLAATSADPVASLINGTPGITFPLRRYTTGVSVTLQTASDPAGPWTDQWKNTDGFTHPWISGTAGTGEVITVIARDPSPLPSAPGSREFLRLKISQ